MSKSRQAEVREEFEGIVHSKKTFNLKPHSNGIHLTNIAYCKSDRAESQ